MTRCTFKTVEMAPCLTPCYLNNLQALEYNGLWCNTKLFGRAFMPQFILKGRCYRSCWRALSHCAEVMLIQTKYQLAYLFHITFPSFLSQFSELNLLTVNLNLNFPFSETGTTKPQHWGKSHSHLIFGFNNENTCSWKRSSCKNMEQVYAPRVGLR